MQKGNKAIRQKEKKQNTNPRQKHIRHLQTFLEEYNAKSSIGYLVFTGERPMKLANNIIALPWFKLYDIFKNIK